MPTIKSELSQTAMLDTTYHSPLAANIAHAAQPNTPAVAHKAFSRRHFVLGASSLLALTTPYRYPTLAGPRPEQPQQLSR